MHAVGTLICLAPGELSRLRRREEVLDPTVCFDVDVEICIQGYCLNDSILPIKYLGWFGGLVGLRRDPAARDGLISSIGGCELRARQAVNLTDRSRCGRLEIIRIADTRHIARAHTDR